MNQGKKKNGRGKLIQDPYMKNIDAMAIIFCLCGATLKVTEVVYDRCKKLGVTRVCVSRCNLKNFLFYMYINVYIFLFKNLSLQMATNFFVLFCLKINFRKAVFDKKNFFSFGHYVKNTGKEKEI